MISQVCIYLTFFEQGASVSDYYHDDPIEEEKSGTVTSKFVTTAVLVFASVFFFQSTLAGNISMNSGTGIEFGQSVNVTAACSGGSSLTVTPRSSFVNASNDGGSYYLSSVQVADIPASCVGKDFNISFYDSATGSSALPIYSSSGENKSVATVHLAVADYSVPGFQNSGTVVSSSSGAFTVSFKTPVALSTDAMKVTLQSIEHKEWAEAISGNSATTCTFLNSSVAKCWGDGTKGQLGQSAQLSRNAPVSTPSLGSGVVDLEAGTDHTCAVFYTGTLKCWGRNNLGQLGTGTGLDSYAPVTVTGLSGVTAVATGQYHTCALLKTGAVKCWGWNNAGQIGPCSTPGGSGATAHCMTPQDVSGLSSGVVAIAAGKYHSCALLNTGGLKCWGYNPAGQLGDGTNTASSTPVSVSGLSSGVAKIAAGGETTCAVLSTGEARCWGMNTNGTLGNSTASPNQNVPQIVTGMSTAVEISVGTSHACAVLSTGGVQCWGYNDKGQVGGSGNKTSPTTVTGLSGSASKIAAGDKHTCAVLRTGGVQCWGWNNVGQLGNSTNNDSSSPVSVTGIP